LLLWLVLLCGPAMAQTVIIGSTTVPVVTPATSSYLYGPIYRSSATSTFNYSRYAHLYTQAELGIPAGAVITELAWLKSDGGTLTGNNVVNVLLANTSTATLGTSQTWGTLSTGATQVYASTTEQITGAAGTYYTVALNQPFTYTGGNLLVLVDHEKQGTASAVINFVTNPATGFGLGYADSAPLTAATALTATSYGNRRPTLRITYAPGGPCTAPPTAGTTLATATTVCTGATVSLSLQGASYGTGQTYQWQESTDGITFTDIAGATNPTYVVASVQATRTYRARLTCTGQSAASTPVTVTLNPATYATLPVAESFENTWANGCSTHDVPTNSWRNTPISGDASWRREDDGATANWTSPTVGVYTPAGSQGTHSARFHSYYAGAGAIGTLDLYVNLSATGNKVLQFDYLNTAGNDSLQVQVSTDGGATFGVPLLRLGISGTAAAGWQPQNVSIASTSATTIVRFRTKVTTTFTSDIGLDNVRLDVLSGVPNCATNFVPASGATGVVRTPTITWNSGGGVATGYDVYFGTTATPPLVVTNQPGTSYTPAALGPNTTYYYRIVPRNANGAATGCVVNSFTTTSTYTYCNSNLGDYCGTADIVNVTIAGTGLNNSGTVCNSSNGSSYTSYPATGSATGTLSPGVTYQLSVTTSASAIISAWLDANQNGTFEASEWVQVATASTANQPATVSITVPAAALSGPTGLRIRSRSASNPNGAGDACTLFGSGEAEDYIVTIGPPPACAPPINLSVTNLTTTSATLNYAVSNGTAVNYTVLYGPTGFNPNQPSTGTNVYTTVTTTSLSVPVTGLTANTTYQFYVKKDCGSGQTSLLNGPFSFSTPCLPPVYASLPFVESFENAWVDGCNTHDIPSTSWRNLPNTGNASWRRDDDGASAAWTSPASGLYSPVASQGTHSARFHTYYAPSGSIGTLDLFVNLSAAGAKRLSFDYINTTGADSLVVQLSTDGGTTFSRLGGYNLSTTFATQVLPINATSATAVVRFRARGDFGLTDIGLDNIVLESATGCLTPASLSATTTTTTATLSWLTGGTGTYTVLYGPTGFDPTQPATGSNVYTTVSGLTGSPYTVSALSPGTTYQFYVTANCGGTTNSGTAGPATFSTQILNDDPCGATTLAVNNTCTPLATTTVGATQTASTVYGTGGQGTGCGSNTTPRDVWFKFTTAASGPASTSVRVSVTGGAASVVRAYSGTACAGPLTFISCVGTASNTAAPNLDLTGLTPNTTYYIRVNDYSSTGTLGNFTICATPVPNCPVPAGVTVSAVQNTSAVVSWSAPVLAGSTFTVIYGPTGFNPATGGTSVTGITAQTTTLTNLQANTPYQVYVQQVCGNFNGSSALSTVAAFTTTLTAPANDEPCGAISINSSGTISGSNAGATTSTQNGINLPACSPAAAPKDVWFTFTATATGNSFTFAGNAAGMVRLFTATNCSTGVFTQLACFGTAANTAVGTVTFTNLTVGTPYYVAVSGFGSSDAPGNFTIQRIITATQAQMNTNALLVYPNPSNTGQVTLRLAATTAAGQATLVNALGQTVRTQHLPAGTAEHTLATRGLATGVYTLRVQTGDQLLTRKVVVE